MSVIPYNTKFTSDSVLYDALGDKTVSHKSIYYNDNNIYFLMNDNSCVKYDTYTENILSSSVIKVNTDQIYSLCEYKGDIYGFNGYQATKFFDDTVLYVQDNTKLIQESFDGRTKNIHLSSTTQIRDFFVDEFYNYYVLHSSNRISKFTKDRILVYSLEIKNTATSLFYDIGVSTNASIELIKIDFVREFTSSGLSSYPIILGSISNSKNLFLMKLDESVPAITGVSFLKDHNGEILLGSYIPYGNKNRLNYNLTNYEYLKNRYSSNNSLLFKMILKNVYDNRDFYRLEVPISTELFISEKHHFAFRMDSIDGILTILLDGKPISVNRIAPGRYVFQDIIYEGMSLGNTYFSNHNSLDKYLDQSGYYFIKNLQVQQFKLYNKALTDNEINFLVLNNNKVEDLVVSLPSGQRNGIDSIVRQFKFDVSGNKSNKINLIVKNSNLIDETLQNAMTEIIKTKIKKVLPANIEIVNIEYRN